MGSETVGRWLIPKKTSTASQFTNLVARHLSPFGSQMNVCDDGDAFDEIDDSDARHFQPSGHPHRQYGLCDLQTQQKQVK